MANKKFSDFTLKTTPTSGDFLVGYNGVDNIRIDPANLAGYPFLIDTQSLYSGFVPSGLSGNPQGNTILGISAGNSLTSSIDNTLIGDSAGKSITNNTVQNVMVGAHAGEFKSVGSQSVLIGYQAGLSSTAGNTIAIGDNAARSNQSTTHLSIGATAGYSNTTGSGNTNIGHLTGSQLTTGSNNTNLGYRAGADVTGSDNVLLGYRAGKDSGAWNNTIIIGKDGATSPVGASNFIVLGNASHTTLQIPGIQSGASNGDVLTYNSTLGKLELQTPSSGGPAGSDTQLQYNNGGAFGAIPGFTYNDTNDRLIIDTTRVVFGDASGTSFQNGLTIWDDVEFRGNKFELSDGSATNPILTFFNTGDNNTGMFRPGSDIIAFATGGQEEFRIGANGEIGLSGANFGTAGQVLTSNGTGSGASWTTVSGGATDLNGLTDCLVDTDSLYVGEVPSGLSGNPQGNTVLGIDAGSSLQGQVNNTLIGNDAGKNFGLNPFAGGVTYVGAFAGLNNTSGSGTTYIGYQAGQNQAGAANTAVGSQALGGSFSGTGTSNVAIGDRAGLSARGSRSTLLGYQTAYSSGTGLNDSILIGYRAGYSTNAANVVQIGSEAGRNNNSAAGHISIGYQAGYSQTSGTDNTYIGYQAGYSGTTATYRTIIGYQAGYGNTGTQNVFIGQRSGTGTGSGANNVAVGSNTLRGNNAGSNNAVLGHQALIYTTGGNNTAVGYQAGDSITTGTNNTVIGYDADASSATVSNEITLGNASVTSFRIPGLQSGASNGDVLTFNSSAGKLELQAAGGGGASDLNGLSDCLVDTASLYIGESPSSLSGNPQGNTTAGIDAGVNLTSGTLNTFFGNNAGKSATSALSNTFFGEGAGESLTTNFNNCFFGMRAGQNITGRDNVGIGRLAFREGGGDYNVCIGSSAGTGVNSGDYNTMVGNSADGGSGNNNTLLGNGATRSSNSVNNEITLGNSSVTALRCAVTSITSLSDERDKSEIEDLSYGLAFIDALQPREFVWDNRAETRTEFDEDGNETEVEFYSANKGKKDFGFIAQEVRELDNDTLRLVYAENEEKLELSYGKLVPILVKAIQELKEEVELLKG